MIKKPVFNAGKAILFKSASYQNKGFACTGQKCCWPLDMKEKPEFLRLTVNIRLKFYSQP